MKLVFRWYGPCDPVKLKYIKQIPGITGVVSALYDIPPGEVWPAEKLISLKTIINKSGLQFSAIESIPIHEDIKLGRPSREEYISNYCESIKNMAQAGIKVLCYNFMPVFDWMRSDLSRELPDHSTCLTYSHRELEQLDPKKNLLPLPGWASYTQEELIELLDAYSEVDSDKLWKNLAYFLKKIIPIAEASGVRMGIHPDDPPWPVFGLPHIITDESALERLISIVDSPANGISLCTGSLGPKQGVDLVRIIKRFGSRERIPFVHCRNIKITGEKDFRETAHPSNYGDINMYAILEALREVNFKGIIRPDHGRMVWDEVGKPGYGLYDRALGATYLLGLWEGINKCRRE